MNSISNAVNEYGRMYPKLDRAGEDMVLSGKDSASLLVLHSVYHVVKGLVLRRKTVNSTTLPKIISEMNDVVGKWIESDRELPCCEFLLEHVSSEFRHITSERLLLDSARFVAFDAPVKGGESSHGDSERNTFGDLISLKLSGNPGSTLSVDSVGSHTEDDDLVYDPDLDAYVRRKAGEDGVKVVRNEVDAGIYSYANEALSRDQAWLERRSPIKSSKITDRIVTATKARRRKWSRRWVGHVSSAPAPGTSASVHVPTFKGRGFRPFDFSANSDLTPKLTEKCRGCILYCACSSWLSGRIFCRGIHGPGHCGGPYTRGFSDV